MYLEMRGTAHNSPTGFSKLKSIRRFLQFT